MTLWTNFHLNSLFFSSISKFFKKFLRICVFFSESLSHICNIDKVVESAKRAKIDRTRFYLFYNIAAASWVDVEVDFRFPTLVDGAEEDQHWEAVSQPTSYFPPIASIDAFLGDIQPDSNIRRVCRQVASLRASALIASHHSATAQVFIHGLLNVLYKSNMVAGVELKGLFRAESRTVRFNFLPSVLNKLKTNWWEQIQKKKIAVKSWKNKICCR